MKQLSILLSLIVALFATSSCNDDTDTSVDEQIARDLPGTWELHEKSEVTDSQGGVAQVYVRDVVFKFENSAFTYTVHTQTTTQEVTYSVSGTWNVKRETLQLYYNLDSLTAEGMTDEAVSTLLMGFRDNNLMLDDLKGSKHQAFGMSVAVTRSGNGLGVLQLTGIADLAGTYSLVQ